MGPADTEIPFLGGPEGLRTEDGRRLLMAGDELITYREASDGWLRGCERGVYNTVPGSYPAHTLLRQPDVDDWPLFIRISQEGGLQEEIAARLAEIYGECGFNFVYFDGAEDVPMPYWYNVARAQKAVYDLLRPAPIYAEGALKSHYGWHILSRGNAFDLFRPEQIRPAMKKYTLRCAREIADDFTSVDFGWLDAVAPDENTIGMQPDMYEYACSKALAWNSPVSLMGKLPALHASPRTADNLAVIRAWEEAKIAGTFTPAQKEMLKDPDREWTLVEGRLCECRPLTSDGDRDIRAFLVEKDGKACLLFWHPTGSGTLTLRLTGKVTLTDMNGKKAPYRRRADKYTFPTGSRLLLQTDMDREALIEAFEKR